MASNTKEYRMSTKNNDSITKPKQDKIPIKELGTI